MPILSAEIKEPDSVTESLENAEWWDDGYSLMMTECY